MMARLLKRSVSGLSKREREWEFRRVKYALLSPDEYSWNELFQFNKQHGSSPLNFIPDEPVSEHFRKYESGSALVWAARMDGELVGLITAECGDAPYFSEDPSTAAFIHEFVVRPDMRGMRIGQLLTAASVDGSIGVWSVRPRMREIFTTVHSDNAASEHAFSKGGYSKVLTYHDPLRERHTTVLRCANPACSSESHSLRSSL